MKLKSTKKSIRKSEAKIISKLETSESDYSDSSFWSQNVGIPRLHRSTHHGQRVGREAERIGSSFERLTETQQDFFFFGRFRHTSCFWDPKNVQFVIFAPKKERFFCLSNFHEIFIAYVFSSNCPIFASTGNLLAASTCACFSVVHDRFVGFHQSSHRVWGVAISWTAPSKMSKRHYRICMWIMWLPNSAFQLSEATRKIKETDNKKEYWKTKGSHDRDLNRFVSLHGFATESVMISGFWNPSDILLRSPVEQPVLCHPLKSPWVSAGDSAPHLRSQNVIFATRQLAGTRMVHVSKMFGSFFTEVYFKTLESLDLFSTYATSLSQFNLKVPVVFYINSI